MLQAAPDVEAPTALAVAANGDVYFAEDPMDMRGPPTQPLDKIWLLKGGDPRKKVLVADKLWAVMGLEVVRNELYCVHPPHVTLFTLGKEGTPVKRQELFDDLGPKVAGLPSFNDHVPSGIRMGVDGWLYVSIGDKGIPKMTRKENRAGSEHVAEGRWRRTREGRHVSLEGGGVIRFRPDGSKLEVFAAGTRNHLDVPLDEHDRIFVRDNTDDGLGWNTRFMFLPRHADMGYPWAYKARPAETEPAIADFGGGSPCGGWVYLDDGLPEAYRGRVFHCEWGKGKVFAVKLKPRGAGFALADEIVFMDPDRTGVKDFRPFTLRPTPDGRGFYVTDWAFSGWLAKVKAGRLWKVTYTGTDVRPLPRGSDADPLAKQISSLGHPGHSERVRAQRALADLGVKGAVALQDALRAGKLSARARRHAVWVIAEFGTDWKALAKGLAKDANAGVRLEVVRALATFGWPDAGLQDVAQRRLLLTALAANDPSPAVRLHAVDAVWGWGIRFALELLAKESDPWVRRALIRSVQRGAWKQYDDELDLTESWPKAGTVDRDHLLTLLAGQYDPIAANVLCTYAKDPDAPTRRRAVGLLARIYKDRKPYAGGWWGTQPAGNPPPARTVAWEATPAIRKAVLAALADKNTGVRREAVAALIAMNDPETLPALIERYAAETNAGARTDIVGAAAGLRTELKVPFLAGVLADAKAPDAQHLEAVAGLRQAGTPAAVEALTVAVRGSAPLARRALEALGALGALKAKKAAPAITAALKSKAAPVRAAAAAALGQLGDPAAGPALLPLLKDRDSQARSAAILALGAVGYRAAVPALVAAAADEATQFDALTALARIPDARALAAYLTGLGAKNADLRLASRLALTAIRDEVARPLEELVKRGEVRADLLPALREVYRTFTPVLSWRLIGPFAPGKVHPPEKELKADASYEGEGKKVRWRAHKADAKQHGRMRLDTLFSPSTNVVAYGWAEVASDRDRDAELLLGSDDTLTVWLNGQQVFDFQGNRGWNHDQDRAKVKLRKGKNTLLVKCGNGGGPWEFSVAIAADLAKYAFLQGGKRKHDLEDYRAHARSHKGDPARGEKLFLDVKGLACVKCHAIAGKGGAVGPDLAGIGLKYKREELMTSILEPSKVIAQGYETVVITTKRGKVLKGVFKGETADAVSVADEEGKTHRVPKKDIEERYVSQVSLMPNGLNEGMTLEDFADVVAYLEARREDKPAPKRSP
jgi:putative heme-binding domain-containing protein